MKVIVTAFIFLKADFGYFCDIIFIPGDKLFCIFPILRYLKFVALHL